LQEAPLDGNHATAHAFEVDPSPLKVNLGRGVYKDDKGKSWVLPSVKQAEAKIAASGGDHEYLPFSGLKDFTRLTSEFAFGEDSPLLKEKRVATVQAISGTGALRVGAEFLSRFLPQDVARVVYLSDPTYVNHYPIFKNTGFELKNYAFYNPKTNALDWDGLVRDMKNAPKRSVFLLHACAHNPTGMDPSHEQWKALSKIAKEKQHVLFFDSAYQGFASGDPARDAFSYKTFAQDGNDILVAQSYAKNFGLYGQRIGAINVVTSGEKETKVVMSQLNQVVRPMYSNPPLHGARIVATVFGDKELRAQWNKDVKTMADRIKWARQKLVDHLKEFGSQRDWSHITNQIGMFAYSGLTPEQVQRLRERHVYMNMDGRMSISGINSGNVEYLAKSMHEATK
jgi:aspartate aminotransferase